MLDLDFTPYTGPQDCSSRCQRPAIAVTQGVAILHSVDLYLCGACLAERAIRLLDAGQTALDFVVDRDPDAAHDAIQDAQATIAQWAALGNGA